jgi:glycosyltransferase involved in cell wall biosynthesis
MKPKLLIIHNRLVVGGPALDTIPLAHYLQNEFEIHILFGAKEKDETEPSFLLEKYKGLKLVNIASLQRSPSLFKDVSTYRFIKKYINQFKPAIVHTHGAKAGFFGRIAAKKASVPLIVHTFHGHLFHSYFNQFFTSLYIFLEKKLARITDVIIAISESQKSELQKILNLDPHKIKMVPLGVDYIDTSMREHYRQAFKRTYKIQPGTVSVGILGRMVNIKNPLCFLKIAHHILKDEQNNFIRFFVIGDGAEVPLMKQYLRQNNIPFSDDHNECAIIFTSWVQNIQNVLEGLDIVVLTSFNEGTPLSLIEAQICGKPVVASNVGGVKDTMINGQTGFLIDDHDVEAFSNAIVLLATDKEMRKAMGEKAAQFAATQFSKQKELATMRQIYMSYKPTNIASDYE